MGLANTKLDEELGYWGAHMRMYRDWMKPTECQMCDQERKLDWAFTGPSGGHSTNPADYLALCRSCHIKYDRRRRG